MNAAPSPLESLLAQYGPLGVLVVSFLGNAIPYSTIPYLILIVVYAGSINSLAAQLTIAFIGGLGASLGKVVVYYFGVGMRAVLSEEERRNLTVFASLFQKSTFLAVFLFASLPLPDDILYVPLGATKYSLTRYFTALLLGKILITAAAVFFGTSFSSLMEETAKTPAYITIPVLLVITLILTYIIAKIDWVKIAGEYRDRGLWRATLLLIVESIVVTLRLFKLIYRVIRRIIFPRASS